jgi:hypothetical protein
MGEFLGFWVLGIDFSFVKFVLIRGRRLSNCFATNDSTQMIRSGAEIVATKACCYFSS